MSEEAKQDLSNDEEQLRTVSIPKLDWKSPDAVQRLTKGLPVILLNTGLVDSAVGKWDIPYLAEGHREISYTVKTSDSPLFLFHDMSNNKSNFDFEPPFQSSHMTIQEFAKRFKEESRKEPEERKYMYLQHGMSLGESAKVTEDFKAFNWSFAGGVKTVLQWKDLTTNMLFIGHKGVVTPIHYDEQENLFAQVRGRKRCLLAHPNEFSRLYPYPLTHPADRQAMVNIRKPDPVAFPGSDKVELHEGIVEPGEVLYIPSYWWHQVESPFEDTISVNFWYKSAAVTVPSDLSAIDQHLPAMRRNIEKIALSLLGPDQYVDFMDKVGRQDEANMTSAECAAQEQLLKMLTILLPIEHAKSFLQEVGHRRFNLPRKK